MEQAVINVDSENAPKQLKAILHVEYPQWKLSQRRITKYFKRHLNKGGYLLHHMILAQNWGGVTQFLKRLSSKAGKDIVLRKHYTDRQYTRNALQDALIHFAPVEVVLRLIEIGGREIVVDKDDFGMTALYYACRFKAPAEIVLRLIEVGGRDISLWFSALCHAYKYLEPELALNDTDSDVLNLLIQKGG